MTRTDEKPQANWVARNYMKWHAHKINWKSFVTDSRDDKFGLFCQIFDSHWTSDWIGASKIQYYKTKFCRKLINALDVWTYWDAFAEENQIGAKTDCQGIQFGYLLPVYMCTRVRAGSGSQSWILKTRTKMYSGTNLWNIIQVYNNHISIAILLDTVGCECVLKPSGFQYSPWCTLILVHIQEQLSGYWSWTKCIMGHK